MFFQRGEHPLCERIERRIATLLNWPVENGEGLQILRYRPGARAKQIACPILVCVCDHDSLVDLKASDQVAQDAPLGEVAHYPIGHFEIYTGEWFERAVSRQSEFLVRHLSAA